MHLNSPCIVRARGALVCKVTVYNTAEPSTIDTPSTPTVNPEGGDYALRMSFGRSERALDSKCSPEEEARALPTKSRVPSEARSAL
jgi:hypothetical protein